jgi:hypothetical protein
MARKNQKTKLSGEAQARVDMAGRMIAEVLKRGCIPEIIIGAKQVGPRDQSYLEYSVAGAPGMTRQQIEYVLRRTLGLVDGSIKQRSPSEQN